MAEINLDNALLWTFLETAKRDYGRSGCSSALRDKGYLRSALKTKKLPGIVERRKE